MTVNQSDVSIPNAWPFEEAAKVVARLQAKGKTHALFETGYGPSGLPHIGTFGEVARTSWVRKAFTELTGMPSKLLAFSDDMDALRRVPTNVPEQDMLYKHKGLPLSRVPDPFGTHESFAAHNNARLQAFLDEFGFDYEFASSTQYYASGRFDPAMKRILQTHEQIVNVIAPTLGAERKANYSPIMPIHPITGQVMEVMIDRVNPDDGTVNWKDPESGKLWETSVYGGNAKMQWKADWAMRWYALDVDYEMSGKDLIDSVRLSSEIVRILGAEPPVNMTYELFLDEEGKKVSKSKGNGMGIEDWLKYGSKESLNQFMYYNPRAAKPIHRKLVPKVTDEYLSNLDKALALSVEQADEQKTNPAWHIHNGNLKQSNIGSPVTYGMLLNLANVSDASDPAILLGFLKNYRPDVESGIFPMLDEMINKSLEYYKEFVKPLKVTREPTEMEKLAFKDLSDLLQTLPKDIDGEAIQFHVYEVGKKYPFKNLKEWFRSLYQVLLGQDEGPRFGHFIAVYGIDRSVDLIEKCLEKEEKENILKF